MKGSCDYTEVKMNCVLKALFTWFIFGTTRLNFGRDQRFLAGPIAFIRQQIKVYVSRNMIDMHASIYVCRAKNERKK